MKLNPYLTFPGTAAEAIKLYKKVFSTGPVFVQRFTDAPPEAGLPAEASAEGGERILHAMFKIGSDQLMISDAPAGRDETVVIGTHMHISVVPESREEADRMCEELSQGGTVTMPMADAFWGDYFGMCTDRFGVNWMINYHEDQ